MKEVLTQREYSVVRVERGGVEKRLQAAGPLDTVGARRLEAALSSLLADDDTGRLVLDLSGVTFVDSAGLRSVLRLYGHCLKMRRELSIIPAPPAVQRVFALTRAADVLPFTADDVSMAAA